MSRLEEYAVLDALGVRLGHVSGCIRDRSSPVHMLRVRIQNWDDATEYLVPFGAVTLIDRARATIHLRDLTKKTITRLCYKYSGELPDERLLVSLQRQFPPPKESVLQMLDELDSPATAGEGVPWKRLVEMDLGLRSDR